MKTLCTFAAFAFMIAFSAVNLFIPYALLVLALAVGMIVYLGVPCGFLARDRKGECRLGVC